MKAVKIAISVPATTFAAVERVRRRLGKSRSAAVSLALEEWLRNIDMTDADRRYIEGYRRRPEALDEIAAVAAQSTASWAAWEPGHASRAAAPSRPQISRAAAPDRAQASRAAAPDGAQASRAVAPRQRRARSPGR